MAPTAARGVLSRSAVSAAKSVSKLYTYIVRHDIGFAPNPFYGVCTLATCKPRIRRTAAIGDWVAGVGSRQQGQEGQLVYAMQVEEILSFDEYWSDLRFESKRPNRSGSLKQRYGDNIYHRSSPGGPWIQEDSRHSLEDGSPNTEHVRRDTREPRVLLSETFVYYGDRAVDIPEEFCDYPGYDISSPGRDYQCNFPSDLRDAVIAWLESQAHLGIVGEPLDWR